MAVDTGGGGGLKPGKPGGSTGLDKPFNPPADPASKPGDPPQQLPEQDLVAKTSVQDIAFLHQFLRAAGFDPGTPSTAWTAELGNALSQWQQSRGLPVTGNYDERTRGEVSHILTALAGPKPEGTKTPPPAEGGGGDAPADLGGGSAPVEGTTTEEPDVPQTEQEIVEAVQTQYPSLSYLMTVPEIRAILVEAVQNPDGQDANITMAKIQNTGWWKTHGASAREWEDLLQTDPATAQRNVAVELGRLDRTLAQLGLTITNDEKMVIVDQILRFRLSEEEINTLIYGKLRESLDPKPFMGYGQAKPGDDQAIAQGRDAVKARVKRVFLNRGVRMQSHNETADQRIDRITDEILSGERTFDDIRRSVDYQSGALTGGTAKGVSNRLHAIASEYMVPMTERDLDEWAIRLLEGSASEDGFRAELQGRATSRFPWLKGQLDAGETVASIFGSHKAALAQTLEMAPEQIDLFNNPRFQHIADFVDDKGQRRSMTLAEVTQWARNQPEFQKTRQANQGAAEVAELIGQTFGKVA